MAGPSMAARAVYAHACDDDARRNKLTPVRRFFTFMLLLFLLHSMGLGMFRVIASLCRDETISSTGGAFFFLVLLLLGGFLLPRRESPCDDLYSMTSSFLAVVQPASAAHCLAFVLT